MKIWDIIKGQRAIKKSIKVDEVKYKFQMNGEGEFRVFFGFVVPRSLVVRIFEFLEKFRPVKESFDDFDKDFFSVEGFLLPRMRKNVGPWVEEVWGIEGKKQGLVVEKWELKACNFTRLPDKLYKVDMVVKGLYRNG